MSWNITENKQIKFADMIMTKKSSWITDLCKIRLTDCIVFFSCSGKNTVSESDTVYKMQLNKLMV